MMRRAGYLAAEAVRSIRATPVVSVVTIVLVAGMCATVLMTTGRAVGAERSVISSIDSAGTRSIVVRADPSAGLDSSDLRRVAALDDVEWAGAFGAPVDASNLAVEDGPASPVRAFWTFDPSRLGIRTAPAGIAHPVWASPAALRQLGFAAAAGSVATTAQLTFSVQGKLTVPSFLEELEPLVVAPQPDSVVGPITALVVVARTPGAVAPVSRALLAVLNIADPSRARISTSEDLARLRAIVEGQLSGFGQSLTGIVFSATALLVAAMLYGFVTLRRRDFGRRRALGASRGLIIALLLLQTSILAVVGGVLGTAAATIGILAASDPLPPPEFSVAVGLLSIGVGTLAALVPGVAASRREPIRELRVP